MEPYRSDARAKPLDLPATDHLCRSVLQFPTGTSVNERDIDTITEIVAATRSRLADVRRALGTPDARS
jgi:dTDP-4-amino-4,6-dideoxygalactose transaminase